MSYKTKLAAARLSDSLVADGDTTPYKTNDRYGLRVIIDGTTGAGSGTMNTQGSHDGVVWYDLGTPFVVAASETRTRWLEEPSTYIRVQGTGVAGQLDVYMQEIS